MASKRRDGHAVAVGSRLPVGIEPAVGIDVCESLAEDAVDVDEATADVPAALTVGNRRANRVVHSEGGERTACLCVEDDAEVRLVRGEVPQDGERPAIRRGVPRARATGESQGQCYQRDASSHTRRYGPTPKGRPGLEEALQGVAPDTKADHAGCVVDVLDCVCRHNAASACEETRAYCEGIRHVGRGAIHRALDSADDSTLVIRDEKPVQPAKVGSSDGHA